MNCTHTLLDRVVNLPGISRSGACPFTVLQRMVTVMVTVTQEQCLYKID